MFLIEWYRQWKEVRREYHEPKVCDSCESLKLQVEQLREDNRRLLDRMLTPTQTPQERPVDNVTPIKTSRHHMPWKVRQQMLEANDKHAAQLLKNAPRPLPVSADTSLQELEDDVLDAEREREAQAGTK